MKSSSSIILIALAVADTLVLWIGLPDHFLIELHNIDIRVSPVACKLYQFLNSSSICAANWLIIIFSVFRLISVYVPHKVTFYCSKKRAYLAIFLTVFVTLCYHTHFLITWGYHEIKDATDGNYSDCFVPKKHENFYSDYHLWIMLIMLSLVPFAVLIICNILIIFKLRKANILRQTMNSTASSSDSNSLTAMLVSISVLFLVTQAPQIVTTIIENKTNWDNYSLEFQAGYLLLEAVTKLLTYVNNVANFFCYCISGKQFRQEFITLLTCSRRKSCTPKEGKSLDTLSTAVESNAT